jgi:hypothetical protein
VWASFKPYATKPLILFQSEQLLYMAITAIVSHLLGFPSALTLLVSLRLGNDLVGPTNLVEYVPDII